jgi:hypothetical protein
MMIIVHSLAVATMQTVASIAVGDVAFDIEQLVLDELFAPRLHALLAAHGITDKQGRDAVVASVVSKVRPLGRTCSMVGVWGSRTSDGVLYTGRNLDWVSAAVCGCRLPIAAVTERVSAAANAFDRNRMVAASQEAQTGISSYKTVTVYHIPNKHVYASVGFAGLIGSITGMSAAGLTVHGELTALGGARDVGDLGDGRDCMYDDSGGDGVLVMQRLATTASWSRCAASRGRCGCGT